MKILFAGGGSLGPVTPLLAVARRMRKLQQNVEFAWVGTPDGPERDVIAHERIPFFSIPTAKLPRYFSLKVLMWPRDYLQARRAAEELVKRIAPDLVIGAGGFTQTPVIRVVKKFGIPCAIHQLDAEPGLANTASAGMCASVTTTFAYAHPPFFGVNAQRIATPTRFANVTIPDRDAAAERFFLHPDQPIVFVLGGGTGAQALNHAIWELKKRGTLSKFQIIHSTGTGKQSDAKPEQGYAVRELFDEQDTLFAYAAADVVISRGGMGTLSELAALKKAAIVVPMSGTHQEKNVQELTSGIVYVKQTERLSEDLEAAVQSLLSDRMRRVQLGEALHQLLPTDDGSALAERWLRLVKR